MFRANRLHLERETEWSLEAVYSAFTSKMWTNTLRATTKPSPNLSGLSRRKGCDGYLEKSSLHYSKLPAGKRKDKGLAGASTRH